jgi:hypothetical protein
MNFELMTTKCHTKPLIQQILNLNCLTSEFKYVHIS